MTSTPASMLPLTAVFSLVGFLCTNRRCVLQETGDGVTVNTSVQSDPPVQSDASTQTDPPTQIDPHQNGTVNEQHAAPEPTATTSSEQEMEPEPLADPCLPCRHFTFLSNRGGRLEVGAPVKDLTRMGFYETLPQIPDPVPGEDVEFVIPWGTNMSRIGIDVSLLVQLCVACCKTQTDAVQVKTLRQKSPAHV